MEREKRGSLQNLKEKREERTRTGDTRGDTRGDRTHETAGKEAPNS